MTTEISSALQQLENAVLEIPFNRQLGLQISEVNPTHIVMNFVMKPELIGNYMLGILHGGVISSVLDMAGGLAAMVSVIHKKFDGDNTRDLLEIIGKSSTIDLHINYIRPGKGTDFIAKANVIHTGNKISFTSMELFSQDHKLIARGSGTYMIG